MGLVSRIGITCVSALACLVAIAAAAPAAAEPPAPPLPDAVMSPNVEYLGSIKQDVGLTTGAKIVGDRMFVTSGKNISIYDISNPASPRALGGLYTNVAWENEEVPTNGRVLAVASDFYSVVPECLAALAPTGCVQFFDVRDPANIKPVGTIPVANHTVECVLDCRYFYGKEGTIIDARGILITAWQDDFKAVLREARDAGELPEHLDPDETAAFLIDAYEGALVRMKAEGSIKPLQRFSTMTLDGLLTRKS